MHGQGIRLTLGLLTIAGAALGMLGSAWHVFRSCTQDGALDGAPVDTGGFSIGPRRWPFLGCDVAYGIPDGGTLVRTAPFDLSWVFLVLLLAGVGLVVHAVRWTPSDGRPTSRSSSAPR